MLFFTRKQCFFAGIGLVCLGGLGLSPTPASAATATATIAVSASVVASCSITANPLSFGDYLSSDLTATTEVGVTCTDTTPYTVGLTAGNGPDATVTTRQMTGGTTEATLNYALYQDSTHSTNWEDVGGGTLTPETGTGIQQDFTVYGDIPAGQIVPPDSYTDSITATVSY